MIHQRRREWSFMAVDYRKQYKPEQLVPFWPNEVIHLVVASLCAAAVIIVLAVLPVVLDHWNLSHWIEQATPADPHATPEHIRPEWYFLAAYEYLKLMPQELVGISGKTLGVMSMGLFVLVVMFLPFWARRWSRLRPGFVHRFLVTVVVAACIVLTLWAVWPPPTPMIITMSGATIVFYVLLFYERRRVRRVLYGARRHSKWYQSHRS